MPGNAQAHFLTSVPIRRFQVKPALLGFESVGENERKDKAVRTQKGFNI